MDVDYQPKSRHNKRELLVLPDADISEPATDSESETEVKTNDASESDEESSTDDETPLAKLADEVPLAACAARLQRGNKKSATTSTDPTGFSWRHTKTAAPQANAFTGHLSGPPDIPMSTMEYFRQFFPEDLWDLIVDQTNLYALQNNRPFQLSIPDLKQFIGILFLMGVVNMPQLNMYWADSTRYPQIADIISRNQFHEVSANLHFADNGQITLDRENPAYDRLAKIRPFLESIRGCCLQIEQEEMQSIDEEMIPFKGKHNLKQYLAKKPNKWGFKVFARCGVSGLTYASTKDATLRFKPPSSTRPSHTSPQNSSSNSARHFRRTRATNCILTTISTSSSCRSF